MSSLVKQFVVTIYLEGDAAKRLRLNDDVPQVAEEMLLEKFPEASVEVVDTGNRVYDQFGDVVPCNLVVLPDAGNFDEAGIDAMLNKIGDWWEVIHPDISGLLVVDIHGLRKAKLQCDETPLDEAIVEMSGADYADLRFRRIVHAEKGWSPDKGFYHERNACVKPAETQEDRNDG